MPTTTSRIDELLSHWEDESLLLRAAWLCGRAQHGENTEIPYRSVRNATSFRQTLSGAATAAFDWDRFGDEEEVEDREKLMHLMAALRYTPYMAWNWCRDSRRVISIDADLQAVLQNTSLADMTWGDLHWPFNTLAVQLAVPLSIGGTSIDCLIASNNFLAHHSFQPVTFLMGASPVLGGLTLLSSQRNWLKDLSRRTCPLHKRRKAQKEVWDLLSKHYLLVPGLVVPGGVDDDRITNSLSETWGEKVSEDPARELNEAAQLFVNVCLWLQSLPAEQRRENSWIPAEGRERLPARSISNGSKVFMLESSARISAAARALESETSEASAVSTDPQNRPIRTVKTHFRSGYWKRAHGTGKDPNAPKIRWTSPTTVNDHLLEDGTLPAGSTHFLEP